MTFGELLIVFSTRVYILYFFYLITLRNRFLHQIIPENFSKNSNLADSGIFLLTFPSRTNLQMHSILVAFNLLNKVITNLYLSKASGPDCIPVVALENCGSELSYILAELFNS